MKLAFSIFAAIVFLAGPLSADYTVQTPGTWPKSWPKELEPLRKQSRTLEGPLILLLHHAIPFTEREDFEAAWPHILKVKSPGAPIVIRRGPSFWLGDAAAGVCIHTPPTGQAPIADAKEVKGRWEKTIYIELIVDSKVVDLNRIPLPPDTPIVDERFKDGKLPSPAKGSRQSHAQQVNLLPTWRRPPVTDSKEAYHAAHILMADETPSDLEWHVTNGHRWFRTATNVGLQTVLRLFPGCARDGPPIDRQT
jgi:hypothetical protein